MSTQVTTAPVTDLVARPTTMRSARGLAHRGIRNIRRLPSAFFPAMAMPVFTMIAFAGTFAAITRLPGFPTDRSVNWFMPLGICFGAAFSGIGLGFSTIRDIETRFYDRLLMSPAPRRSLIIGPLLTAWVRVAILCAFVIPMGLLLGVRFTGGLLGLLTLVVAAVGVSTISLGWGLGLAFRFRDMRGAAVMQLTMFVVLYLSTAQMPLPLMRGWLHNVARFNPTTNILRLAREGLVLKTSPDYMSWSNTWGGLLAIAGMATLTLVFARRGLDKLDK
jgi:ABC-2 type transport system permease protein